MMHRHEDCPVDLPRDGFVAFIHLFRTPCRVNFLP
jgi:hypothetical protein